MCTAIRLLLGQTAFFALFSLLALLCFSVIKLAVGVGIHFNANVADTELSRAIALYSNENILMLTRPDTDELLLCYGLS